MLSFSHKHLIIAILVNLCIALVSGSAFGTIITLDGRDDAGIKPGQDAFAEFIIAGHPSVPVNPSYGTWSTRADIDTYVTDYNSSNPPNSIPYWNRIQSAGNIWSSDKWVGDSYLVASAGTYTISPFSGAYKYDSFGSEGNYANKYWWKVYIEADAYVNGNFQPVRFYSLGQDGVQDLGLATFDPSSTAYNIYAANSGTYIPDYNYSTQELAFNAVKDLYIDIPMAAGGRLSFWIWDWNSIDNSGSVSLNVSPDVAAASVPEPSTVVLLAIGFFFLLRKMRSAMGPHSE